MIPYTAMAYDQRGRWDRFTRMLPYSDRTVVLSRYALGWISLSIGSLCSRHLPGVFHLSPLFPAKLSANLSPGFVFAALCVGCLLRSEYHLSSFATARKGPVGRHSHYTFSPLLP